MAVLPDAFDPKKTDLGFLRKNTQKFEIAKIGGYFWPQKTSKKIIYYYKNASFSKKVKSPKKYLAFAVYARLKKTASSESKFQDLA